MITPKKWAICFIDDTYPGRPLVWWDWLFTRKNFRHVFAMTFDASAKRWLLMDWRHKGLFIGYIDRKMAEDLIYVVMDQGCAVEAREALVTTPRCIHMPLLYCVSSISKLLGIASWRILTPYQLYRALKRRGCPDAFTGDDAT